MVHRSVIVPLLLLPFSALVYFHRRSNLTLPALYMMMPEDTPSTSLFPSKIIVSSRKKNVDLQRIAATARWYVGSYRNHQRWRQNWKSENRARRHRSEMRGLYDSDHSDGEEFKHTRKADERGRQLRRKQRGKKRKGKKQSGKEAAEAKREAKREAKEAAKEAKEEQMELLSEQQQKERRQEVLRQLERGKKKAHEIAQKLKKLKEAVTGTHGVEEQQGRKLTFLAAKKARTDAALEVLKYQSEYYEYLIVYGPNHILTQMKKRNYEQSKVQYENKRSLTRDLMEKSTENPIKPREIMERSRLVLKWRKYRWTSGAKIGRPCDFDGNKCSLDAYCKHFPVLGWRCSPIPHTDNGQQSTSLQGWQYNSRSEAVYRRVVAWTQAIPDGEPCTPDGPRCSLGLECKLIDAKKGARACVRETTPEDVAAPEEATTKTKFTSVLIDRVDVASDIDGIAESMKDRSSFGEEFCGSIYDKVAAKCEGCRVLVLPLHGKSFTLRIAQVKFHAKVYFSVFANFVDEYGIWLYQSGAVDLDNWPAGGEWCLRE